MAKTGDVCTFCGRSSRDVNMLINGISGAICDECAQQAYEIVKEQQPARKSSLGLDQAELPKPEDIKNFLDQYVDRMTPSVTFLFRCITITNDYSRKSLRMTWRSRNLILLWSAQPVREKPCWLVRSQNYCMCRLLSWMLRY